MSKEPDSLAGGTASASVIIPNKSSQKKKPISPGHFARRMKGLDCALILLLLVFAFLLGSFAAANSDLWMHLATGRLISQGQFEFGKDPFAYTTSNEDWTWINHSWLFDLVLYRYSELFGGVESALGGAALVSAKAFVVVGLAAVLLCLCRRGHSLWIPVICTALAVLTISSRLHLQPVCISFFFLALTLFLILGSDNAVARNPGAKTGIIGAPQWVGLPVLFGLWANLDDWFILGPLTLGLYLAGEWLQMAMTSGYPGAAAPYPRDLRLLCLALILGIAAVLLTPYHVHGFTLPMEIWVWFTGGVFRKDIAFSSILRSGFEINDFLETKSGFNAPGLSFFLLLAAGLVSFLLNRRNLRFGRLFVWGFFCIFSLYLGRLTPFFAISGGAIAALNLQEFAERQWSTKLVADPRWRQWLAGGRVLSLIGLVALIVLVWPGWLHRNAEDPYRSHHVSWAVPVDPSLKNAALKLCQLRESNILHDADHGFNFQYDIPNYCAWFCPREKGFFDLRLSLFRTAAISYLDIQKAFFPRNEEMQEPVPPWQELFRDQRHSIDHVVISSMQREAFKYPQRFWGDPDQWVMLFADGRTFIFGWKDPDNPEKGKSLFGQELRFPELAFAPGLPDEKKVPDLVPDPPRPKVWLDSFLRPPSLPLLAVDEAVLYQNYLDGTERYLQYKARKAIARYQSIRTVSWWANPATTSWTGSGWPAAALSGKMMAFDGDFQVVYGYLSHPADALTSSSLLLSIRAARRAIAAGTQDWRAYFALGQAYQSLLERLENRWTGSQSALHQQLRQIQVVNALENALVLKPDQLTIHKVLGDIYSQMYVETFFGRNPQSRNLTPFHDLAVEHWRQYLAAVQAVGPNPGDKLESFQKQLQEEETMINRFKKDVERKRDEWVVEGANRPPLEKAQRALFKGLVKQAADQLRDLDSSELGVAGTELKNLLLLCSGDAKDVPASDIGSNPWNVILLTSALGHYSMADKYLEELFQTTKRDSMFGFVDMLRSQSFGNVSPQSLYGTIQGPRIPLQWAEYLVLRGLLALETGNTEKAAEHFRAGLQASKRQAEEAMPLASLSARSPLEASIMEFVTVDLFNRHYPYLWFPTQRLSARYLQFLRAAGQKP